MTNLIPPSSPPYSINCTYYFLNCLTAGAVWVCAVRVWGLWHSTVWSSYQWWRTGFILVAVVNLWMLWSYPCLADNPDMTQIGKWKSFCLIELVRVWAWAVSQGQSNIEFDEEKENLMDLKDYLSMACLLVQCNREDLFLHFPTCSLSFSLDGKSEFIQTDAHSTLTTVRQLNPMSFFMV